MPCSGSVGLKCWVRVLVASGQAFVLGWSQTNLKKDDHFLAKYNLEVEMNGT